MERETAVNNLVGPVASSISAATNQPLPSPEHGSARPPPKGVVGIGASAGGLKPIESFVQQIGSSTGRSYVIVSHQLPNREILLDRLVQRVTPLPVKVVIEGMLLETDTIYVAPDADIELVDLAFHVTDRHSRSPINTFFKSLAENQKENAVGVVLSGTGTDGVEGLKALHSAAALTLAQDPKTAEFDGMPTSAIDSGFVDYVLTPDAMSAHIDSVLGDTALTDAGAEQGSIAEGHNDDILQRIISVVRARTGHDFASYKHSTIRRRIERRKNVHRIDGLKHYLRFLRENPAEVEVLFRELLINVTAFFRDADAFAALRAAIEPVIASLRPGETFRAWIPACSSGEEAYSIAILLREMMTAKNKEFAVQIFATDLDTDAIDQARLGRFPVSIREELGEERTDRFFKARDGYLYVTRQIREMLVFAPHNILRSPPFTRLHLVSCRNLLIYLDSSLQRKLIPLFHYALKPNGLLFLGLSETVGGFNQLFSIVDKRWKLYSRQEGGTASPLFSSLALAAPAVRRVTGQDKNMTTITKPHSTLSQIDSLLLTECLSPSVLINSQGEILHIHGRTGKFLEPASGQVNNNLFSMAREGLQVELATAVRKALADGGPVVRRDVKVRTNGDFEWVNVYVKKIEDPEAFRGLILVRFEMVPPPIAESPITDRTGLHSQEDLERELRFTREHLNSTIEELEVSNEELKSANEELQSTNEELQSTNEELETTKEETQSLNEELQTVNTELQTKIEELSQASDDLTNLLNSTEIATIFLDEKLHIKKFTKQVRQVVKLINSDIGRSIGDIVIKVKDFSLVDIAEQVLETLIPVHSEILTEEGAWFITRVAPYRDGNETVAGVVVTFVNMSELVAARATAATAVIAVGVVSSLIDPILVLDPNLKVLFANSAFSRTFSCESEIGGRPIQSICKGNWNKPELIGMLQDVFKRRQGFQEHRFEFSDERGPKRLKLYARAMEKVAGSSELLVLFMREET